MEFLSRITALPLAFDPEIGADTAKLCPGLTSPGRDLLAGAAGSSPYLAGLIRKEANWLSDALIRPPEDCLSEILDEDASPDPGRALRQAKRRVALLTALADLGGVWSLAEVTGALTRFADHALGVAARHHLAPEIARGRLPGQGEEALDDLGGLVFFAMGKMGAHELNYSSDIDLVAFFDESRYAPDMVMDARRVFVRVTRAAAATLSDLTGEGYVFRTDLRLRPDPSVTPVCIAMDPAESYYETQGRTWERAAWIKARPAAGDFAAGDRFLERLRPFVWRRHLDFAAIEDAHDIRLRIRAHKGLFRQIRLEDHNIKLGTGGIRDIEFFTQTRQLISGGRDPSLRCRATQDGLAALARAGWVPPEVATELSAIYTEHRRIEHRLQMVNDAQTHSLPQTEEGFRRLACLSGEGDVTALRGALRARLARVAELTEDFFETRAAAPREVSLAHEQITEHWPSYPALRSQRAQAIFDRLRPDILSRLERASKPQEALVQFDRFLSGLPAGVQLFSLFEANPQILDLLVDICAAAPGLARYLSRHSGVLDAVLGGDFFSDWPGRAGLDRLVSDALAPLDDYEARLEEIRRWRKDWHFRIGVHHLRGLADAETAALQYSDLAEVSLNAVWTPVVEAFSARHGPLPGRGAAVLGMGSLGARALNAGSDLDLVIIYDAAGEEMSSGRRPLAVRLYYARLTQALVTALSAQMSEGRLYEVDMRLRPSGTQGPVAASITSFRSYQQNEAWTWEHLALTRARPVAGSPALMAELEDFRGQVLDMERDPARIRHDVAEMRAKLAAAKPGDGAWEAKSGAGRMTDIALVAQMLALLTQSRGRRIFTQLEAGVAGGWISDDERDALHMAYGLFATVSQAVRLMTQNTADIGELGAAGHDFLLRETDFTSLSDLSGAMDRATSRTMNMIDDILAR